MQHSFFFELLFSLDSSLPFPFHTLFEAFRFVGHFTLSSFVRYSMFTYIFLPISFLSFLKFSSLLSWFSLFDFSWASLSITLSTFAFYCSVDALLCRFVLSYWRYWDSFSIIEVSEMLINWLFVSVLSLLIVSDSMWALLLSSACNTLVRLGSISVSFVFKAVISALLFSLKFSTKFAMAFSKYTYNYISPTNFITVCEIETAQFRSTSATLCEFVRFPFPWTRLCFWGLHFLWRALCCLPLPA